MNLEDITVENAPTVPYVSRTARARAELAASTPNVINREDHLERLAQQRADDEAAELAIDALRQQKETR